MRVHWICILCKCFWWKSFKIAQLFTNGFKLDFQFARTSFQWFLIEEKRSMKMFLEWIWENWNCWQELKMSLAELRWKLRIILRSTITLLRGWQVFHWGSSQSSLVQEIFWYFVQKILEKWLFNENNSISFLHLILRCDSFGPVLSSGAKLQTCRIFK